MSFPIQPQENQSQSHDFEAVGKSNTFRLPRPGSRPLVFNGTELAMAMSFTPEISYWYEVNLYRTLDQEFVAAIRLFYQSDQENDVVKSWRFCNLDKALDFIESYDAGADIRMPHLEIATMTAADMAATALQLKAEISAARHHFAGLVGELFFEIDNASAQMS